MIIFFSLEAKTKEDISSTETLVNIVAKDENSDYISNKFTLHICYIEQEDFHLLDDPWSIKSKYFVPFQTPSYVDKPKIYYETVMNQTNIMDINYTIENSIDSSSMIFYNKCIIKKIIKLGTWDFNHYQ